MLHVHLDAPLPQTLSVGAGTAFFAAGWCVATEGRITSLTFVVDGEEQAPMAFGMPRLDVLEALHPDLDPYALAGVDSDPDAPDDPHLGGYRSDTSQSSAPARGVTRSIPQKPLR